MLHSADLCATAFPARDAVAGPMPLRTLWNLPLCFELLEKVGSRMWSSDQVSHQSVRDQRCLTLTRGSLRITHEAASPRSMRQRWDHEELRHQRALRATISHHVRKYFATWLRLRAHPLSSSWLSHKSVRILSEPMESGYVQGGSKMSLFSRFWPFPGGVEKGRFWPPRNPEKWESPWIRTDETRQNLHCLV